MPFRGTVTISPRTLTEFYIEVMQSVFKQRFRYLIALNGHGGNIGSLTHAAQIATTNGESTVIVVNWWKDLAEQARKEVLETPEGHAAEDETSQVMFVRPDLVDMSNPVSARVRSKFRVISGLYREEIAPSAMHGDPRPANEEKGKAMMEEAVEELVQLIQQLERDELPLERS